MSRRHTGLLLVLLVIMVAAKGIVWTIAMPIGQQPDEPSHAVYAEHIALTGILTRGPRPSTRAFTDMIALSGFNDMIFRPEQIGHLDTPELDARERAITDLVGMPTTFNGDFSGTAIGYPPLSYAVEAAVTDASRADRPDTRYLWQRIANVLIACVAAVLQFFVFMRVLRVAWQALSATLFLQMMPMYSSASSAINPDNLMGLLVSAFVLQLLRIQDARSLRWRDHSVVIAVLVAAVLTKQTAVALAPAYALLCVVFAWRDRPLALAWMSRLGVTAGAFVVTGIAWMVSPLRPLPEGGDINLISIQPNVPLSLSTFKAYAGFLQAEGVERFGNLFWAGFGWVDVAAPAWIVDAGLGLFVVGLTFVLVRWMDEGLPLVIVLLASVSLSWLVLLLAAELPFVVSGKGGIVQGRYMFPVVVASTAIVYWGLQQGMRMRPQVTATVMVMLPVAMAAYQVYALLGLVLPRYYL